MAQDTEKLSQYRGLSLSKVSEKQRKEALAKLLRESKQQHDADEAERERLSNERHAARMEDFRSQISRDDRFTDEEKEKIIKASYEWGENIKKAMVRDHSHFLLESGDTGFLVANGDAY
jgi:hypothetical protein